MDAQGGLEVFLVRMVNIDRLSGADGGVGKGLLVTDIVAAEE